MELCFLIPSEFCKSKKNSSHYILPLGRILFILIQEGPDGLRCTVVPGGNLDSAPAACRMNDLAVSDIHGYMIDGSFAVGIEDQVSRAHLAGLNGAPVFACSLEVRGRPTPATWLSTYFTNPEQSAPVCGSLPPQTYRPPTNCSA